MDSALRDTTWKDLDDKLKESEDTIGKKRKLEAMLRKVKEEQGTIPEHIYKKVENEYQKQLSDIFAVIEPLEAEITEAKESVSLEIKELETAIKHAQDSLAEIEFRFKVGEFDDAVFAEKQNPLQETLDKNIKSRQALIESLQKYDSFADALCSDTEIVPAGEPAESASHAHADEETRTAPLGPSEPAGQLKPEPEFVNPNEWLDDFTSRTETSNGDADNSRRTSDSERFEDLLETGPAGVPTSERPAHAVANSDGKSFTSSDTTPMLVIKSKTGTEKRVPVLPITLTIGREHDNNIEIKDEEAARYHARILFKSGHYVLESLEGSRSTMVNGKHVTEAVLQDADTITIGRTKMFFMME
jgi:hypothetical protein